ncbi:HNH endonuclease [Mesorhizobium sp.]|uniref:HNH endonuclease n=1 Tax=Mesorhizobium sp. TaxID=1871066 RepID=UPI002580D660|nr:HNH endonuclease [Mesorhizobium sp.]
MRKLAKLPIPEVLDANHIQWLEQFLIDVTNKTNRYRYRHPDIKGCLVDETKNKCVYCESKIGHNTPGDVEHMVPTAINPNLHFIWINLTIACTECNRRKNAYYSAELPFLDPYTDDIEDQIEHHGPIVGWKPNETAAETSIRILELEGHTRIELVMRKIEKIEEINNLVGRVMHEAGSPLGQVLSASLLRKADPSEEYSGMVKSVLERLGITNAIPED